MHSIYALHWRYQIEDIFKAAEDGDPEPLDEYLKNGGDINARDPRHGLTLYQIAVAHHNIAFAKAVAAKPGFNPFLRDFYDRTALDIAHATSNSTMIDLVMSNLALPENDDDAPSI